MHTRRASSTATSSPRTSSSRVARRGWPISASPARPAEAADDVITTSGLVVGTPSYMSPEQAVGSREIDPRSDLYALGTVLYEMLTGEPPFTGATPQAIMARQAHDTPTPVALLRPAVPTGPRRAGPPDAEQAAGGPARRRRRGAPRPAAGRDAHAPAGRAGTRQEQAGPVRDRRPRGRRRACVGDVPPVSGPRGRQQGRSPDRPFEPGRCRFGPSRPDRGRAGGRPRRPAA